MEAETSDTTQQLIENSKSSSGIQQKCSLHTANKSTPENQAKEEMEVLALDGSYTILSAFNSSENLATLTGTDGSMYVIVPSATENNISSAVPMDQTLQSAEVENTLASSSIEVLNADGVPIQIGVCELLSTLSSSQESFSLSSSILSATNDNRNNLKEVACEEVASSQQQQAVGLNMKSENSFNNNFPKYTYLLRDCKLVGDTFTGYVYTQEEMESVTNMYKKCTESLFSVRQTPPSSKMDQVDSIRLMWKSFYVPFDGIPFINLGRRATVMECEHGPRKRLSALKRYKLSQSLTCPARILVKKVQKFPQFKVPVESSPKEMRQLQEQSLRHVRQSGFEGGETRLYIHLPTASVHKYHNDNDELEGSVDPRVFHTLQLLVRQGFKNSFVVRTAIKNFVENQMRLKDKEERPSKLNKQFYPPMIEIQNLIQQTETALNAGLLTYLPPPELPPIPPPIKKRKMGSVLHDKVEGLRNAESNFQTKGKSEETDTHVDNLSNFSYEQLQQLAKIGLVVLNNAAKDKNESALQNTPAQSVLQNTSVENVLQNTPAESVVQITLGQSVLQNTPVESGSVLQFNSMKNESVPQNTSTESVIQSTSAGSALRMSARSVQQNTSAENESVLQMNSMKMERVPQSNLAKSESVLKITRPPSGIGR